MHSLVKVHDNIKADLYSLHISVVRVKTYSVYTGMLVSYCRSSCMTLVTWEQKKNVTWNSVQVQTTNDRPNRSREIKFQLLLDW